MVKRLIALVVSLCIVFGMLPARAEAQEEVPPEVTEIQVYPDPFDPLQDPVFVVVFFFTGEERVFEVGLIGPGGISETLLYGTCCPSFDAAYWYGDIGPFDPAPPGRYLIYVHDQEYDRTYFHSFWVEYEGVAPPEIEVLEDPIYYLPQEVRIPIDLDSGLPIQGVVLDVWSGGRHWTQMSETIREGWRDGRRYYYYVLYVWPDPGTVDLEARYVYWGGTLSEAATASFRYIPPPPTPVITEKPPSVSGDRIVTVAGIVPDGETPAARVEVFLNGSSYATVPLTGNRWSVNVTLQEGPNHIVAVSRSASGVGSRPSSPAEVLYDPEEKYAGDLDPRTAVTTLGGEYLSGYMADPINTATGNFVHQETDLVIFGKFPLVFERWYNSLDPYFGSLGNGWKHSFEYSLDLREADVVTVVCPDGRRDRYHLVDGELEPPPGVSDVLRRNQDGKYTLETVDRVSYVFAPNGMLTAIRDRDGRTVTVSTTTVAGFPRVSQVQDQFGRGFTFTYDERARIVEVRDHTGRAVSFAYDEYDNLVAATDACGNTILYSYDDKDQMTEITGPDGVRFLRNVYDEKFRVIEQYDALGRKTTFQYDRENSRVVVTAPDGTRVIDRYDERFRLLERTGRDGHTYGFSYDEYGYRNEVTFKDGRKALIGHDARGRITSLTAPDGATSTLEYDEQGNLTSITDPVGRSSTFLYDEAGRLTESSDPAGVTTYYEYDERGNLISVRKPSGQILSLSYDEFDQLREVRDQRGLLLAITYNEIGLPVTVTQAGGRTTTYRYDLSGRPVSVTDPEGRETTLRYNWRGQVVSETLPGGNTLTYEYNPDGTLKRVTDSLGRGLSYEYDDRGNVVAVTNALGETTRYSRNAAGYIEAIIDPSGAMTRYHYDANGWLTAVEKPSGARTEFRYDATGRPVSVTDPAGAVTRYEYDPSGNLIRVVDPHGLETRMTYDQASRLVEVVLPTGATRQYLYDEAGRVERFKDERDAWFSYAYDERENIIAVTDPLGRTSRFDRDEAGNVTAFSDPKGSTWTFFYDLLGRLTAFSDPLGARWTAEYDVSGNLARVSDPLGRETRYTYDQAGRLTSVLDPLGRRSGFTYDLADRLIRFTDPRKAAYEYAYDSRGLLTALTDPLGRVRTWTYDAEGRVATETGPDGRTASYTYNPAGQVTGITYSAGADSLTVRYGYDQAGFVQWMSDERGVTFYGYDEFWRPSSVVTPEGRRVEYEYDEAGYLTSITYPDRERVLYEYDSLGRLVSVTDPSGKTSYAYDAADLLTEIRRPNGLVTRYTYDPAKRVASVLNSKYRGETASYYEYEYDLLGQVTAIIEGCGDSAERTAYKYNEAGWLVSAEEEYGESYRYSYDDSGNLVEEVRGKTHTLYVVDPAGEIVSRARWKETPDGPTTPVVTRYFYDEAGRLLKMARPVCDEDGGEDGEGCEDGRVISEGVAAGPATGSGEVDDAGPDRLPGGKGRKKVADPAQSLAEEESGQDGAPILLCVPGESSYVTTEFAYDAAGRLVEVCETGRPNHEKRVRFFYDGNGNRVRLEAWVEEPGEKDDKETGIPPRQGLRIPEDAEVVWAVAGSRRNEDKSGQDNGNHHGREKGNGPGSDSGNHYGWEKGKHYGWDKDKPLESEPKAYSLTLEYVNDILSYVPEVLVTYDRTNEEEGPLLRERFVYGIGRLAAYDAEESHTWYLHDGLGNVRQLADSLGKVFDRYRYTPYGSPVSGGTLAPSRPLNDGNTFGFGGQDHDPVFGLIYLRARYYAPELARFTTPDPLAMAGFVNPDPSVYSFALNNPLSYVDPTGLIAEQIGIKDVPTPAQLMLGTAVRGGLTVSAAVFVVTGLLAATTLTPVGLIAFAVAGVFTASHVIGLVHDVKVLYQGDYAAVGTVDPLYNWAAEKGGTWGVVGMAAVETLAFGVAARSLQLAQYPRHLGFQDGKYDEWVVPEGKLLARYGKPEGGRFVTDPGTSPEKVSLPPWKDPSEYHVYRVEYPEGAQPLKVKRGIAAPAYNQPGGGIQYVLPRTVEDLLNKHILKEVELSPGGVVKEIVKEVR